MPIRKSIFADTVEEALAQATRKMGTEALLVGSRRTDPAERHLGVYEVIVEGETPPTHDAFPDISVRTKAEIEHSSVTSRGSSCDEGDLELIRREIMSMRDLLARCAVRMAPLLPPELLPLGVHLSTADFSPTLVESLLHSSVRRLTSGGAALKEPKLQQALISEISSRLRVDPALGTTGGPRKVVAFAGPAGSGKTSTLVKLAVRFGLAQHSPTLIISADTYRVAAADQLRTYSAILGVNCEIVETPSGLSRVPRRRF